MHPLVWLAIGYLLSGKDYGNMWGGGDDDDDKPVNPPKKPPKKHKPPHTAAKEEESEREVFARDRSTIPASNKEDVTFPGPNWKPYSPPPAAVQKRASSLLPVLWEGGEGTRRRETVNKVQVIFVATPMGEGKKGVTAWRLKAGTVVPASWVPKRTKGTRRKPSPSSKPVLKRGSRGEAVAELQRLLGGLSDDGIFGPKTESAVIEYQVANSLEVDGIVGPETWGSLLRGRNTKAA